MRGQDVVDMFNELDVAPLRYMAYNSMNTRLMDIINKSNIFQVSSNSGSFAATILKSNDEFIVQAGGKVNTEFIFEEDAGDKYLDIMEKYVDDTGKLTSSVSFKNLEDAAKSVCFDNQWQKVTYTDFSEKSIYELINSDEQQVLENKIKEEPIIPETKHIETPAEEDAEDEDIEVLMAKLGKEIKKSKVVELGDKSLKRIEEMHKPIEETPKEEIDSDFDWGEDESEITTEELVGVDFTEIDSKLKSGRGAVILEGVPGTGKTKAMMAYLNSKAKAGAYIEKITFHQEYTYQEFIGGITCPDGEFKYIPGVFTKLCYEACKHPEREYYLGIDEFSRGNPEAILGEVMTAICTRGMVLTLSSGKKIKVPKNLFIVATMNITDNSTKDIDLATYQRFNKVRLDPQWTVDYMLKIANGNDDVGELLLEVASIITELNIAIKSDNALGKDKVIGVRDISIDNPTLDRVIQVINGDLVKTIERTTQMCYGDTKSVVGSSIEKLRKACNDARNKASTK